MAHLVFSPREDFVVAMMYDFGISIWRTGSWGVYIAFTALSAESAQASVWGQRKLEPFLDKG
jgi:hypothetical protein